MEGSGLWCPRDALPGWGGLPLHLPPFARCFVASVNEELHLVSVALGNVPSVFFLFFL